MKYMNAPKTAKAVNKWINFPIEERFRDNVMPEPNSGCWFWTGAISMGYGVMSVDGKSTRAHRLSWNLHRGKIPEGMFVCHKCDNPACVRPDHLFLGDQKANMSDCSQKGMIKTAPSWVCGERQGSAKLTEKNVRMIRESKLSTSQLGRILGVCHVSVWNARVGKTWKHIPMPTHSGVSGEPIG